MKLSLIWHFVSKWILIGCAALLLLIAVGLALADRVAAGSLVAGLFIVVALLHYLPQMESFKAYGVEAKWREKIGQADEILKKLQQSTLASAKLTYLILGWGSRMGGPRPDDRRDVANQVDAALLDLDVGRDAVLKLKKDYLIFTAYDLFETFDTVVQSSVSKAVVAAQARLSLLAGDDVSEPRASLLSELAHLKERQRPLDLLEALPTAEPRSLCLARVPTAGLPEDDAKILRAFALEVSNEMDACLREGRITDRAIELLTHHRSTAGRKALYSKLFRAEEN
jgi:hypothetical protein